MLTRRAVLASGFALAGCGQGASGQNSRTDEPLRLSAPRAVHSTVCLPDGSALFFGGCVGNSCETGPGSATIDRYDPDTRTISGFANMLGPRIGGAVAPLREGGVLVAGGWAASGLTAIVEKFDPTSRTSEQIGEMSAAQTCRAIALDDGRVLLVGERSVDVFDSRTGRIEQLSSNSPYLESSTATLLNDGQVLVVGGGVSEPPRTHSYLLDPATGRAVRTDDLKAPRHKHAAVRLLDGKVLIVGGSDSRGRDGGKTKVLEVYDPSLGRFETVGETRYARYKIADAAVRLEDGRVVLAGGAEKPEIIDPKTWRSRPVDVLIGSSLNFAAATTLPNDEVLVSGGYDETTINPTDRAWIIPRRAMA